MTGGVVVGCCAGGVEVAGGVTTGAVAGFTITVALPCTCFEVVALGIKTMESGTLVEAVPERSGVTVSVLLVVATVYAAPHGIAFCAPAASADRKRTTSLH